MLDSMPNSPLPADSLPARPPMSEERLAEIREEAAHSYLSYSQAWDLLAEIDRLRADAAAGLERERDYRARMMMAGSMICLPVSEKNLREAKALLTPAYHDAVRDYKASRVPAPEEPR